LNVGGNVTVSGGGILDFSLGTTDSTTIGMNSRAYMEIERADLDGKIKFFTTTAGAGFLGERMRIDENGNVGIGTAPSAKLHINAGADNYTAVFESTDANALISFKDNNSASILANYIGAITNDLVFGANSLERMRITSGGQLQVGGTAQSFNARIVVHRDTYSIESRSTGTGSEGHFVFNNGNGAVGSIFTSGTSTAYNTSSDYRLKEDLQPINNPLQRLDLLNPINFAWKTDGSRVDGFIAHELAEVVPEAVTGEKDAVDEEGNPVYQGIDQSKIVPLLVGAIKELKAEIETLKSQING
jgi:hypothetical protein